MHKMQFIVEEMFLNVMQKDIEADQQFMKDQKYLLHSIYNIESQILAAIRIVFDNNSSSSSSCRPTVTVSFHA